MYRSILRFAGVAGLGLLGALLVGSRFGTPEGRDLQPAVLPVPTAAQQVATFAGGCFWSMQKAFDGVPGVVATTAGYSGGTVGQAHL